MKQLRIAVMALFVLASANNVNAQDENTPWAVSLGASVVDIYSGTDFSSQLKDGLGNKDWNFSVPRIAIDRYLSKGFTVQLAGSLNNIKNHLGENDADYNLFTLGASLKYDLNNLFGETSWFDPYVFAGGNYASNSASDKSELMPQAGLGFNTWFNDKLGLNFQHGSNLGFAKNVRSFYQNSLGLVYKFGGKDTDKDGVYDKDDACPEIAGLEEFNGCPDADNDGVKDSDDACPNVAGLVELNGCPDTDGDGVADKDDMCVNTKGTKANNGCPDSDEDNVLDKDDKCPNVAGPVENAGCPWPDTDGDGVLDKDDKCPNIAGPASAGGCSEEVVIKQVESAITDIADNILFDTDKYAFKAGVTNKLDAIASIIKKYSKANFVIEGHADDTGSRSTNQRISEKRANAVKNYLITKGILGSRLITKAYGESKPINSNKTAAGRAQNRRVEIKVSKE